MAKARKGRPNRRRDRLTLREAESRINELMREVEHLREKLDHAEHEGPRRKRLPDTRHSITHKFSISGHEGYITVGLYDDDSPGEVFIRMAKMGSTVRGLVDTIAVLTSLALQYGVPVDDLARKFKNTRFEPSGYTKNPEISMADSITDYVFAWLNLTCPQADAESSAETHTQG